MPKALQDFVVGGDRIAVTFEHVERDPLVVERLGYPFLEPGVEQPFPSHGWITGCTGIRHLRIPILRLYQLGQPTYGRFVELGLAGVWLQSRSPYNTLRLLAVVLRDLHTEILLMLTIAQEDWGVRDPSHIRNVNLGRLDEGNDRTKYLSILAFVLLRRLADELIDASRPLLFNDWPKVPNKLGLAREHARNKTLAQAKPICNLDILTEVLLNASWYANAKSIRDKLMHSGPILGSGATKTKSPEEAELNWKITAHLTTRLEAPQTIDLFPALVECISGACQFMDQLYRCVGPLDGYQQGDVLFLAGCDNNIVGFWPPILETRTEFPLTA